MNPIAAFWFGYIITHPLGASFADWTGKARAVSGLNYGDGPVSLILALLIVAFVAYLAATHKDAQAAWRDPALEPGAAMSGAASERAKRRPHRASGPARWH